MIVLRSVSFWLDTTWNLPWLRSSLMPGDISRDRPLEPCLGAWCLHQGAGPWLISSPVCNKVGCLVSGCCLAILSTFRSKEKIIRNCFARTWHTATDCDKDISAGCGLWGIIIYECRLLLLSVDWTCQGQHVPSHTWPGEHDTSRCSSLMSLTVTQQLANTILHPWLVNNVAGQLRLGTLIKGDTITSHLHFPSAFSSLECHFHFLMN